MAAVSASRAAQGGLTPSAAASAALLALAFAWGLHRCPMGLVIPDDGLYLAAPMRYALGDLPFRDEILNPHRMFDVLLAPLFWLDPDVGVLELRQAWLVCQFGAMLALFALLRRFAPTLLVAAACAAVVLFNVRAPTPGYQGMSATLLVLSASLWLSACLGAPGRRSDALALASGVAAFLGALCYLPLVATWAVPAAAFLLARRRILLPHEAARASALHLAAAGALALLAVALVFAAGLAGDWWQANLAMLSHTRYGSSGGDKLAVVLQLLLDEWRSLVAPPLVLGALLWLLARLPDRLGSRVTGAVAGTLAAGAIAWLAVSGYGVGPRFFWGYRLLEATATLALGLQLAALWVRALRGLGGGGDWGWVWACLVAQAALYGVLQVGLSGHPHKLSWAMLPLFTSGVIACYRVAVDTEPSPLFARRVAAALVAGCLVFGVTTQQAMQSQKLETMAGFDRLDAHFSEGPLAGIYSTRDTVASYQDLLAYLKGRVAPGDYLLAYDFAPLVYYLTRTRPAIDAVWHPVLAATWVRQRSLDYMLENHRVPEYCVRRKRGGNWVRYTSDPRKDPLNHYVVTHYELQATFGRFEVWKRKAPPAG